MQYEMGELYTEFAYDDAFRTMTVKCDDLLLPFLNYTFGEHYDKTAMVIKEANEHLIDRGIEVNERRITDGLVQVSMDGVVKKYHTECESSSDDGTILIRLFEYDAQIALEDRAYNNYRLKVRFPNTAVLFLRSRRSTPEEMYVDIETPGGKCSYPVRVVKLNEINIDAIFDKHLYFLIPFYLFTRESEFPLMEHNPDKVDELLREYDIILSRLTEAVENNFLSAFSRGVIIKLIKEVNEKLTNKYKNVNERVGEYMGGKVLDIDIIKAHDEGVTEGEVRGEARGEAKGDISAIKNLMKNAEKTFEQACELLGINKEKQNIYKNQI